MTTMPSFPAPHWLWLRRALEWHRAPEGGEALAKDHPGSCCCDCKVSKPIPYDGLLQKHTPAQAESCPPTLFAYFAQPGLYRPAGGRPW